MYPVQENKEQILGLLHALEQSNLERKALLHSDEYTSGDKIIKIRRRLKSGPLRGVQALLADRKARKTAASISETNPLPAREETRYPDDEYFSGKRIAVYTCIFGPYDELVEPLVRPDNIDYYIITDQDVPAQSAWKKICPESLNAGWSNADQNRYWKMHPHELFPSYEISVYIDGNIRPVSDFTPFSSHISECGLSMFAHSARQCAYDEVRAACASLKITDQEAQTYLNILEKENLPRNYGLAEGNVLVRAHHQPECIALMEDWWEEYRSHFRRDQIALPVVLSHHNIPVNNIAVLGPSVFENRFLEVVPHRRMEK